MPLHAKIKADKTDSFRIESFMIKLFGKYNSKPEIIKSKPEKVVAAYRVSYRIK